MLKNQWFVRIGGLLLLLSVLAGCQAASSSIAGPTMSSLQIVNSSNTALASGSTTTSRILTISGTLADTTITTINLTVNTVSMKVSVSSGNFSQDISLINGTNTITISATNSAGGTSTKEWTVNANIAHYGIHAQLSWDTVSDMDLHFNKSTGSFLDTNDCYYLQKAPNWDGTGSNTPMADTIDYPGNPVLDFDNVTSYGPENIVLQTPVSGTSYVVKVQAYRGSATPVVRIYINDTLTNTFTASRAISSDSGNGQEVWTVCTISWNGTSGTVTPVGTFGTSSIKTTKVKPVTK